MTRLDNILVLAQPGPAESPALRRAIALALRHRAKLHLCAVAYSGAIAALRVFRQSEMRTIVDEQMARRRQELLQQVERLRGRGIQASCSVLWGAPVHEVAATVIGRMQPDLVIHDVNEVPALRVAALTPTDWNLLRLCPAPLMLVKAPSRPGSGPVIAAVDTFNEHGKPPELNDTIVAAARVLAEDSGVELHVVQAFQDLTEYLHDSPMREVGVGIHKQQMARHKEVFEQFAERLGFPEDRRHFRVGYNAEHCITELVSSLNASLLVIGTVHRTGLGRLLIGSTTERVLSQVTCDVLALKPPGFAEDFKRYLSIGEVDYLHQGD